jgi:hypothetical protein
MGRTIGQKPARVSHPLLDRFALADQMRRDPYLRGKNEKG